jgi:hypothetical protein
MNSLTRLPRLTSIRDLSLFEDFVISGAAPLGINERADAVRAAADGTDLNDFWNEVNQAIALRNAQRNRLIDMLTFRVVDLAEEVTLPGAADFEKASEYGLPKGIRTGVNRFWRGFNFDFYDLALKYTWMFLADADITQLRVLNNTALEADNRLVFGQVMKCLFNSLNGTGITDQNIPVTVYKFYNGDAEVPPPYKNVVHTAPHNHYVTSFGLSASATLVPAVVEAMSVHLDHHGYSFDVGYRKVLWVNKQEADIIRLWRVATGAPWDFIPTAGYGGGVYLPVNQGQLVGQPTGVVPGQIGTYGPWHIVQEDYIPAGYTAGIATGGPDNIGNPIGLREHKNPAYRGLNIIPGNRSDYPLIESFYQRGVGTGIRHRGAGIVMQVAASGTYTIPAIYV